MEITVSSPVVETPRVSQVRGMFGLPESKTSTLTWQVALPLAEKPWHIGLIVGPSGCGKSTIARALWPSQSDSPVWPANLSILDGFPASLPIGEVTGLLSAVGLSSPPAWLRPFQVLSTGQQFRIHMARLLAERMAGGNDEHPLVVDEFTSVVDRTVAQVASAALARAIRARQLQFVAVSCHEDIEAWLQPDWVYRPAEQNFTWRFLQRRPPVQLQVVHCQASAWPLFAPHHYLSGALAPSAVCFLAYGSSGPVAFSAWLPFVGAGPPTRREHRTVALPDYQGIGIGNALSALIASMWKALGYRAISTTTHPAMVRSRYKSALWRVHRPPSMAHRGGKFHHATTRLTAGFAYVGPAMNLFEARALYGKKHVSTTTLKKSKSQVKISQRQTSKRSCKNYGANYGAGEFFSENRNPRLDE